MKALKADVAAYLEGMEPLARERLLAIRELAFSIVPDADEAIKYGIPTILYHGNLVHFAGFKKHIGFYPVPSAMEAFKTELSAYKQGKGSIQFPLTEDLPMALIERMIRFRVEETLGAAKKS